MFPLCRLTIHAREITGGEGEVGQATPLSTVSMRSPGGDHLGYLGRKFNKTLFSFHHITGDTPLGISIEKETEAQGSHAAYLKLNH